MPTDPETIRQELVDAANDHGLGHVEATTTNEAATIVVCDYDAQTVHVPEGETLAAVSTHQSEAEYLVQAGEGTGRFYDVTERVDLVDDLDDAMDLAASIVASEDD